MKFCAVFKFRQAIDVVTSGFKIDPKMGYKFEFSCEYLQLFCKLVVT